MSSLIILLTAAISADPLAASQTLAPPTSRSLVEISREIREVLRAEALANTPEQQSEAVHRMAEIYRQILADPRLPQSNTLKGQKAKLWSRLTRIQEELERRWQREARGQPGAADQAAPSRPDPMNPNDYTPGGPAPVAPQGGGAFGGRAVNDHGQELIELIQRTIKPDSWDTAGGPGSIVYYQPLKALVVRATSEVHGNVGGLLGALRRAGQ